MDKQFLVKLILQYVPLIVIAGLIFFGYRWGVRKARQLKNRAIRQAEDALLGELAPYAKDIASGLVEAAMDNTPKARSTGGATTMCLEKVQKDFKDFHAEDADTDVKSFILEYLQIKYGGQEGFDKARVSDKVMIDMGDRSHGRLTEIKVNHIAISDYKKSLNSATLRYRVSVGFTLNGQRKEKLYEVEYTLQLRDEYDSAAYLMCKNCGAPLKEADGMCPYCGTKHVRDTISNWVVADVMEK